MSARKHIYWQLTALALVVCLLMAGPALAQVSADHDLSWHLIAGSSIRMESPNHNMWGSLGQPASSVITSDNHKLCGGFWCLPFRYQIYLPLSQR